MNCELFVIVCEIIDHSGIQSAWCFMRGDMARWYISSIIEMQ